MFADAYISVSNLPAVERYWKKKYCSIVPNFFCSMKNQWFVLQRTFLYTHIIQDTLAGYVCGHERTYAHVRSFVCVSVIQEGHWPSQRISCNLVPTYIRKDSEKCFIFFAGKPQFIFCSLSILGFWSHIETYKNSIDLKLVVVSLKGENEKKISRDTHKHVRRKWGSRFI